jgi:hypothetical protein
MHPYGSSARDLSTPGFTGWVVVAVLVSIGSLAGLVALAIGAR